MTGESSTDVSIFSGRKKGRRRSNRSSAAAPSFSPADHQLLKLAVNVAGISLAGGKGNMLLELSVEAAIALRRE
jgi:hypothetical protein